MAFKLGFAQAFVCPLSPRGEGLGEGTDWRKHFASYCPKAISLRKTLHAQGWSVRHVG